MKIQTQILEILYQISKETDIDTIVKRSGLNRNQVKDALTELRERGLVTKRRERAEYVGKNNPPFKKTWYIINKKRLNKIEAVIEGRVYIP